ncbi:MAG: hypothetical protein KDD34_01145 [Bdellovibrionales bacterium]|nr:hypothetical protein [Bdellovibrionales bacterium]
MKEKLTFREIFIEHIGQKSLFPEGKSSHFDPTIYENTLGGAPSFHFYPSKNARIYHLQRPLRPRKKVQTPPPPKVFHSLRRSLLTENQLKDFDVFQRLSLETLSDVISEAEFKSKYRKTIKRIHPDQGGNASDFILFLRVYKSLCSTLT